MNNLGFNRYSFSFYLYHMPLLIFFAALTWNGHSKSWSIAIIYVGTIAITAVLAPFTELRKTLLLGILKHVAVYRPGRMTAHRDCPSFDGEVRRS